MKVLAVVGLMGVAVMIGGVVSNIQAITPRVIPAHSSPVQRGKTPAPTLTPPRVRDAVSDAFAQGQGVVRKGGAWSCWWEGSKLCTASIPPEQLKGLEKEMPYEVTRTRKPLDIVLDVDGVVLHYDRYVPGVFGAVNFGAVEFIKGAVKAGHKIILHTARPTSEMAGLVAALETAKLMEFITTIKMAKPHGHIYIDDRGLRHSGSWTQTTDDVNRLIETTEFEEKV